MQKYTNPGTGRKATLPDTARSGQTRRIDHIIADFLASIAPAPPDAKPAAPKLRPPVPAPSRTTPRKRAEV